MFPMRNIVGSRVREARLAHLPRLTQEDLATRVQLENWSISRSGIAKIELGLRKVTDVELLALASALDVSPSWLLGEKSN